MQRDTRVELAHHGLHLVPRRPQFGRGDDVLQVLDDGRGVVQLLTGLVQRAERIQERARLRFRGDRLDAILRLCDELPYGRPHVFGAHLVERDRSLDFKERV